MKAATWKQELQWVKQHIPETDRALRRFPSNPLAKVAVRFHVDLKMVPVIEGLANKCSLLLFPCHADTTEDGSWHYLEQLGSLKMEREWSPETCRDHLREGPAFLCDLGGEMIAWALGEGIQVDAALEGTTSGLNEISKAVNSTGSALFPIYDWNNARLKREIHNEKMVGFSLWQTFSEVTRLSLHGESVGLFGFGPVGRGIARMARALGARVAVYDPCPRSSLVARFEGFWTPDRRSLLNQSKILVTATGRSDVLSFADLSYLPSGAIVLNAGHSEREWSDDIREAPSQSVLDHVHRVDLAPDHHLFLLAEGRLLNLAAGFGDTINAFDVTSAQLVEALRETVTTGPGLQPGLHPMGADFFRPYSSAVGSDGSP